MEEKQRKTDRRTLYTRSVIKDAMLELLQEMPFDKITIAALCKQAELTRPTFYLHYNHLMDVLDALIEDAVGDVGSANTSLSVLDENIAVMKSTDDLEVLKKEVKLSPCQRGAPEAKYKAMFHDPVVGSYLMQKIFAAQKKWADEELCRELSLSPEMTEKLVYYLISGSFALNRMMDWNQNMEWYQMNRMIYTFIRGGYEAIQKEQDLSKVR